MFGEVLKSDNFEVNRIWSRWTEIECIYGEQMSQLSKAVISGPIDVIIDTVDLEFQSNPTLPLSDKVKRTRSWGILSGMISVNFICDKY